MCAIRTPGRRRIDRAGRFPSGRAGELDRAVGRLLLVTIAEVRLEDATLRCHRLREVCDPYMRMPSETAASVASPTDDLQERRRLQGRLPDAREDAEAAGGRTLCCSYRGAGLTRHPESGKVRNPDAG
jgi:hypothetical protein